MKKIILISVMLILSIQLFAQVWVKPGATWHYSYYGVLSYGYEKFEYTKDTLLKGIVCQKIERSFEGFTGESISGNCMYTYDPPIEYAYTYVSGDTVFYFEKNDYIRNNDFYVLYNFGASVGDSWIISIDTINSIVDTSWVVVTETGTVEINQTSYRFITIESDQANQIIIRGKIVERFGNMSTNDQYYGFLFPRRSYTYAPHGYLRCFEDSEFTLYNVSGMDCDFTSGVMIDDLTNANLKIYPNPTTGIINFETPIPENSNISIYNIQGKLVRSVSISEFTSNFNVSDLNNGIYFIKIYNDKMNSGVYKVVKIE